MCINPDTVKALLPDFLHREVIILSVDNLRKSVGRALCLAFCPDLLDEVPN